MARKLSIAAAVIVAVAVVLLVSTNHRQPLVTAPHVRADLLDGSIEKAIRDAKIEIGDLTVGNAGGVVVLRGIADTASAQRAVAIVKSLGISRVANLIQPPAAVDDDVIRRDAERQLASTDALNGCILHVGCEKGVLTVTGTVQHDLQRDVARAALRRVQGAREVRVDLSM